MCRVQGDHFAYSYGVKPGVNRDSHGLKVAQLAGMPHSAMKVAQNALLWLKSRRDGEIHATSLRTLGQSLVRPDNL
jgi:DNA mismatch repair ATPase MutS